MVFGPTCRNGIKVPCGELRLKGLGPRSVYQNKVSPHGYLAESLAFRKANARIHRLAPEPQSKGLLIFISLQGSDIRNKKDMNGSV